MTEMNESIQFKRKLRTKGDSVSIVIPPELKEWLGIDIDEELTIVPLKGKKGKYIAIWKE